MTITLVNLVLAPLAALALVPLLVHLFASSRPPRVRIQIGASSAHQFSV